MHNLQIVFTFTNNIMAISEEKIYKEKLFCFFFTVNYMTDK